MKKTYGVSGLMEWQAVFRHGRATLSARFSGGALTGYGVTPAEYTTSNPVAQHIIESSRQFRDGRIRLLRCLDDRGTPRGRSVGVSADSDGEGRAYGDGSSEEKTGPRDQGEREVFEFADASLAREWMIDTLGLDPREIPSQKAMREYAEAHGMTIKWR